MGDAKWKKNKALPYGNSGSTPTIQYLHSSKEGAQSDMTIASSVSVADVATATGEFLLKSFTHVVFEKFQIKKPRR